MQRIVSDTRGNDCREHHLVLDPVSDWQPVDPLKVKFGEFTATAHDVDIGYTTYMLFQISYVYATFIYDPM